MAFHGPKPRTSEAADFEDSVAGQLFDSPKVRQMRDENDHELFALGKVHGLTTILAIIGVLYYLVNCLLVSMCLLQSLVDIF